MEKCVVYYAMWEYECCGTGFGNGYPVKWLVAELMEQNPSLNIGKIDYIYQGHTDDWERLFVLEGTVESTKYLFEKSDNTKSIPFHATDFILDEDEMEDLLQWNEAKAFIVGLKDCAIRPATKEDLNEMNYIL